MSSSWDFVCRGDWDYDRTYWSRGQDLICKNNEIQLMKNSRMLAAEICHTFRLCQSCRGGDWWLKLQRYVCSLIISFNSWAPFYVNIKPFFILLFNDFAWQETLAHWVWNCPALQQDDPKVSSVWCSRGWWKGCSAVAKDSSPMFW